MAYALAPSRSIEQEIRRIAFERLDDAIHRLDRLEGASGSEIEDSVHEVRKRCKETRGLARLVRPTVGPAFRGFDCTVRDAAAELSSIRDAHALLATFDDLRDAQTTPSAVELDDIRVSQAAIADDATSQIRHGDPRLVKAKTLLVEAEQQLARWSIPSGFGSLAGGLKSTYRSGRRGFQRAQHKPTDRRMHEWRKAVKYLCYQIRLLEEAAPSVLQPMAESLDDLADALGDDHDLAVLIDHLKADPDKFGDRKAVKQARRLARKQQRDLRARAFRLGATLYAERTATFVDRIETYWTITLRHGPELPTGGIADLADRRQPRRDAQLAPAEATTSDTTVERERKYLIASSTDVASIGAELGEGTELRQGYLAIDNGVSVRVRDAGTRGCTLTIKSGRGAVRTELEWTIDRALFDEAWALTGARRIAKTRYRIPFEDHVIELDVFAEALSGLIVAEVEFDSEEEMAAFYPPAWFGRDVTDDVTYTNSSLAMHGLDVELADAAEGQRTNVSVIFDETLEVD